MRKELQEYLDEIRSNKKDCKGNCDSCPLQGDYGPALIECADDSPEVAVVSESPMTKSLEYIKDMTDRRWTLWILRGCYEEREAQLSLARTMGRFVGGLTRGKVYDVCDETRTHGLYWTHTVKCFLQNEKNMANTVKEIKEERKKDFEDAIQKCSQYLREEMKRVNARLLLIIAVGVSVAGSELRKLGFSENLCEVYHPAWNDRNDWKRREKRLEKLNALCQRAEELNLKTVLSGCVSQ